MSQEEGKTKSLAPGGPALAVAPEGQVGSSCKDTGPHAPGPWLCPSRGAGREEAGAGLGTGVRRPRAPLPEKGGSYTLETDLEYQKGPYGLSRSPAASGLIVYSVTNAFVSFINFKYKQNKNHIVSRQ